mmetsp:Transcript_35396/g.89610  ORF Transcript_35396/g.89610 Transcript_35396/m.89610 type:complete len:242 (-) Transcript_35396:774-1499(-)
MARSIIHPGHTTGAMQHGNCTSPMHIVTPTPSLRCYWHSSTGNGSSQLHVHKRGPRAKLLPCKWPLCWPRDRPAAQTPHSQPQCRQDEGWQAACPALLCCAGLAHSTPHEARRAYLERTTLSPWPAHDALCVRLLQPVPACHTRCPRSTCTHSPSAHMPDVWWTQQPNPQTPPSAAHEIHDTQPYKDGGQDIQTKDREAAQAPSRQDGKAHNTAPLLTALAPMGVRVMTGRRKFACRPQAD